MAGLQLDGLGNRMNMAAALGGLLLLRAHSCPGLVCCS
jgi:hypothetical protein